MAMKMADLKNLDANNIGAWPGPIKAVLLVLICAGALPLASRQLR